MLSLLIALLTSAIGSKTMQVIAAPPEAYLRKEDRELARRQTPGVDTGEYPCMTIRRVRGFTLRSSLPYDRCYKMSPARRMRGIWTDDFEGSIFLPAHLENGRLPAQGAIWLDTEKIKDPRYEARADGRRVAIDFIGRRSLYRFPSGHLGAFYDVVVVDRILGFKEIPRLGNH